jgi:hypothetical protein
MGPAAAYSSPDLSQGLCRQSKNINGLAIIVTKLKERKFNLESVEKTLQEGRDYVVCRLCGKRYRLLTGHINRSHIITLFGYMLRFPNTDLVCTAHRDLHSRLSKAEWRDSTSTFNSWGFRIKMSVAKKRSFQRKKALLTTIEKLS